jgi:DNA-binding NarL/FixJ family response regulator
MTSGSNPIRIIEIDDYPIFRQGIKGLLADQPDMTLVAEGCNGSDAIQLYRTHRRILR